MVSLDTPSHNSTCHIFITKPFLLIFYLCMYIDCEYFLYNGNKKNMENKLMYNWSFTIKCRIKSFTNTFNFIENH